MMIFFSLFVGNYFLLFIWQKPIINLCFWLHFSLKLEIVIASEPLKVIFLRNIMLLPFCKIMSEKWDNSQHSWICEEISTILSSASNSVSAQYKCKPTDDVDKNWLACYVFTGKIYGMAFLIMISCS